ncbi:MAG: glycoside hydrolase family 31 protein [Anaerolineales bacterium]|nr:glycoside hydrolase family 31 protein [Anaerolineales bacterium]
MSSPIVRHLANAVVRITHFTGAEPPDDPPWLRHVLLGSHATPGESSLLHIETGEAGVRILAPDGATLVQESAPPQLEVRRRRRALEVDIPKVDVRLNAERIESGIKLVLATRPGERFYGWGEWFDTFARSDGEITLRNRDAIALIQNRATYAGIPLFLSSHGYAFWLLNSYTSTFQLDPDKGQLEISATGPPADYIVIYGPSFKAIIERYTALTGRPPLIPRWAFGLFVTGYPQEEQDVVVERVLAHRKRQIPLDAVILDYHWEEGFHNFRWRASLFPKPDRFIAQLRQQHVRLGLILTPFLNNRNRPLQKRILNALAHNVPAGLEEDDERAARIHRGVGEGVSCPSPCTLVVWRGGMFDFSNVAAAEWWNEKLRPLYDQDVEFFKNDDGEYLPPDGRSALGMDGREYHNLYGFYYGRALYEGMAVLDERRGFIYARSVWAGSQRYPALFLGDQKPTFAHMRSALRAGLNLSLLGFAYWTPDVFGLDGKTTPETHMRYAQWALLAPVARYFWRPPAIDDTRFPWSHGPEAEANFRTYAGLRYRLLPYYYLLAWEAHCQGIPIVRPMVLEFQADARFAALDDQFMLGDRLLVAPVLDAGVTTRQVELPEGAWFDFWDGTRIDGPAAYAAPAPLDRMPLFVRGGTILPLGPELTHVADDHRFEELALHAYPPYPATVTLYDDDGMTRLYQGGVYWRTEVTVNWDADGIQVEITDLPGSGTPGKSGRRWQRFSMRQRRRRTQCASTVKPLQIGALTQTPPP